MSWASGIRGNRKMIRRLLILAGGGTILFMLGVAPAAADNGPHVQNAGVVADGCATCHRVHTAKVGALLKEAQPALCYTCHGSTGTGAATDVVSGLGYASATRLPATPGALRGGGFSFALIDSAVPTGQTVATTNANGVVPVKAAGAAVTSTHEVTGATVLSWGNGAINAVATAGTSIQLRCGSCHDPHGNGNYRTLRSIPTQSGGASTPIVEAVATVKTYTTANFWKVDDVNTAGYIANVSAWCTTCHTRYLANTGAGSTTSGDAIYTYRHISTGTTQGSASCVQCHVAHGSNASMGTYSDAVSNPDGTVATGDSRLLRINNRGTCQMCHNR